MTFKKFILGLLAVFLFGLTGFSENIPDGTEECNDFRKESKSTAQSWKAFEYLKKNKYPIVDEWMKITST